jgi:hypothetical protein
MNDALTIRELKTRAQRLSQKHHAIYPNDLVAWDKPHLTHD